MIVTLLDGSQVDSAELTLDRATYTVSWLGYDVTNNMRQSDKVAVFPGFDRTRDNNRAADQRAQAQGRPITNPGSSSTFVNFTRQIVTDPLAAPLEFADDKITGRLLGSSTVRIVTALVVVGAVIYFWPAIRPFVKRFTK